jgi:hypothetical protein
VGNINGFFTVAEPSPPIQLPWHFWVTKELRVGRLTINSNTMAGLGKARISPEKVCPPSGNIDPSASRTLCWSVLAHPLSVHLSDEQAFDYSGDGLRAGRRLLKRRRRSEKLCRSILGDCHQSAVKGTRGIQGVKAGARFELIASAG